MEYIYQDKAILISLQERKRTNDDKISIKKYTEKVGDGGSIIGCSFDHSAVGGPRRWNIVGHM